ncbi:MAG: type II secretion system protein GspM [Caldimonas sp.]
MTRAQPSSSLLERYARLSRRERALTLAAALAIVAGLGHLLLVEPVLAQRRAVDRRVEQQRDELLALRQAQAAPRADRNDALRLQLGELQAQLRATDRAFGELKSGLVQPQHMGALLQSLLGEHRGLQLISLRSLPVAPIGEPGEKAAAAPAPGASAVATVNKARGDDEPWLYRHGVEIKLQGSYADMVAYLRALEQLPRRVHWGALEIDARRYPASVLTVTLYTVSSERSWWVL